MRENPDFALDDPERIAELIRHSPWATLVSAPGPGAPVASHYPVLLDEEAFAATGEIALLSHMGRPDEIKHGLGDGEVIVIIQGPHGYISPSWYASGPAVPTWNFAAAHLTGPVDLLSDEENLRVLDRLVEHFESALPAPRLLHADPRDSAYAARIVAGTVGFRVRVTGVEGKEKMSQDKPESEIRRVVEHLQGEGPYANPPLAHRMVRVNGLET